MQPNFLHDTNLNVVGWYTDVVRRRGWVKRTITIRKFNTFLGLVVPAASLVIAGYIGSNTVPAVAFFIVSAGFNTFTVPGCKTRFDANIVIIACFQCTPAKVALWQEYSASKGPSCL